jgi:hypothetical protein
VYEIGETARRSDRRKHHIGRVYPRRPCDRVLPRD